MKERRQYLRMTSKKVKEQRKFLRIKPDSVNPVLICFPDFGTSEFCEVADVSLGGARIRIPDDIEELENNTLLNSRVKLPDLQPFPVKAEVRNILDRADGEIYAGIQFLEMNEQEVLLTECYIRFSLNHGAIAV